MLLGVANGVQTRPNVFHHNGWLAFEGWEGTNETDELGSGVEHDIIKSQIDCSREITEKSQQNMDIQAIDG